MGSNSVSGTISSIEDFEQTPRGQFEFWDAELKSSQKSRRDWHRQADKIVKRYLDSRNSTELSQESSPIPFRLNLFHSNITTLSSMLYGNVPQVDVSRRYADPNDDAARVAAEMMERLLNLDIADNGEEYNCVLRAVLQDRLLAGLGTARLRYEVETEMVPVPPEMLQTLPTGSPTETEQVVSEAAPIDYFHWRDILWSWGRTWAELDWIAFRVYLNKDEATEQFGEEAVRDMQFKAQVVSNAEDSNDDPDQSSVWQKTEIWEIWDKKSRNIIFVNLSGPSKVLKTKKDELGLKGFFPTPPFFLANQTTSLYQPVPDYHMAQDLYNEIDRLQTRIAIITEAVKVVGVYNSDAGESVGRMFKEGVDNKLIPVDNWALFGEKGGLAGQIDWVPIQDITIALKELRTLRDETIQLLYQVTGMNDIMRGGSQGQYEGVGQAQLQAKFGSVRVQALQDEFARFASDLLQIKAEIISKHFDPASIVKMSNMNNSYDADMLEPAVMLIKDPEVAVLRVSIRPESVAMTDFAELKAERTDYINALSTFMQSATPLMEAEPATKPLLLQLLQWGLAGFKGASEIEGVLDKAIQAAEEAAQQPEQEEPDPAQVAAEAAQSLEQMKQQGELSKIQAKAQADQMIRQQDMQADIDTGMAAHQAKMEQIDAELRSTVAETQVKMEADLLVEQFQAQSNMMQQNNVVEGEIKKDVVEAQLDLTKEQQKTTDKITEIAASASAKIQESNAKESSDDD